MLLWRQASLRLLLCAERTFWGDATVWFDFSFWFDVSYCSNVPSEASFRVAPFAASHGPVEGRLALGLGALGEHLKSCHSVSFDIFADARNSFVRLRSGNTQHDGDRVPQELLSRTFPQFGTRGLRYGCVGMFLLGAVTVPHGLFHARRQGTRGLGQGRLRVAQGQGGEPIGGPRSCARAVHFGKSLTLYPKHWEPRRRRTVLRLSCQCIISI
jgi:hypothetical protein